MIGPFKQRSSWPSSVATGLIGWVGVGVIAALALGYTDPLTGVFVAAVLAASVQVAALRVMFSVLGLDRAIARGVLWGGLSGALIVAGELALLPFIGQHPWITSAIGVYVGATVGSFLSYFHRDDRAIEAEARAVGQRVDYGRDAHWLDPFVYGAVSYELAFLPRAFDPAIAAAVVGMIMGVAAAGVSHFVLSRWQNAAFTVPTSTFVGIGLGISSGFLFRGYARDVRLDPLVSGAMAGGLTFLVTATVGRSLARREREALRREGSA